MLGPVHLLCHLVGEQVLCRGGDHWRLLVQKESTYPASTRQSLFTDRTEDVMKIIEKVTYSIHDTKIVQLAVCGKFA